MTTEERARVLWNALAATRETHRSIQLIAAALADAERRGAAPQPGSDARGPIEWKEHPHDPHREAPDGWYGECRGCGAAWSRVSREARERISRAHAPCNPPAAPAPTQTAERPPDLERCLRCSEGILDHRLGGMCGDHPGSCPPDPEPSSTDKEER